MQRNALADGLFGWDLELAGDQSAHRFLLESLEKARPDDAVLSEEGDDDGARLDRRRTWIVDPLDGSSGFGALNNEWAVHVALAEDGVLVAGAVASPGNGLIATTGEPIAVPSSLRQRPVVAIGRSKAWSDGRELADALDADLLVCSSAGVKALLVLDGQADVYVHHSPLYEWDVGAPAVVAQAAGLHVSDTRGSALVFNRPRPVVPGLLISRPELAPKVIDTLQNWG